MVVLSNGKMVSEEKDTGSGMIAVRWLQDKPHANYLICLVAGYLKKVEDKYKDVPLAFYTPASQIDQARNSFKDTKDIMGFFEQEIGVTYPWAKYYQVCVDDFGWGGMENTSITTLNLSTLHTPEFENLRSSQGLVAHEMAHQWFGDLVTCKDWGNIWLNEGFATFMEYVWTENYFPKDQAEYERWSNVREWFEQANLWAKPVVRHDFDDSSEFDGNAYGKGGMVLYMLRHQIGEDAFYRGLKHYLEANRGKNVVSADLAKAIEEETHTNVDQFFTQWVYGAGAPKFDLSYAYDDAKHQVALKVKQTQKLEGRIGLFRIPTDVEITTASGTKSYPITVSKAEEAFALPVDTAPGMV